MLGKEILMEMGSRPLRTSEVDTRSLIQSAFEADMEIIGQIAGEAEVRELHAKLVAGMIDRSVFFEAIRRKLQEQGGREE